MNAPHRGLAWDTIHGVGRRWLTQITGTAIDLLLPPACNFCGQSLRRPGEQPLICEECRQAFLAEIGPSCPRCAAPVHPLQLGPDCPRCRNRRYAFHATFALGIYRDRLREAVIRMKQQVHEPLTISMGHMLAEILGKAILQEHPDLLVSVPTHWLKRLRRGVNGPDLLAEAVGARLSIRIERRLLYSRRSTKKQGTLLPGERMRNVRNAFAVAKSYDLLDTHVLLVDDIMTTGATANEAARVLRRAGARRVTVLVVARGVGMDRRA